MTASRTPQALLLVAITLAGFVLTGCSTGTGDSSAPAATNNSQSATAEPEPEPELAPDLSGEWKQTNSQSADSYQAATITGNVIEINWVSDNGDTRSLYWAGTFEAPATPGSFAWESVNDTAETDVAMLASGDPTKTFSYDDDDGEISYDVSALGTTMTVRLGR